MRGVPEQLRAATEAAHDAMLEGFRRLDYSQRHVGGLIESFQTYLPARAAASGLVPRYRHLSQEADALVAQYLGILDHFPFDQARLPQHFEAAQRAYRDIGPRLAAQADALDQLLLDYDAEFTRAGREAGRARQVRDDVAVQARRVADAVATLRQAEAEPQQLSSLLASTKQYAVQASDWQPQQGVPALERIRDAIQALADDAARLAVDFPQRIAKARTRRASLRTVVQSVESRMERLPDDFAALRREFSLGNWQDLDGAAVRAEKRLTAAREALLEFDRLVDAGADWARPLELLDTARKALDDAGREVDGPGERLRTIREFKRDPEEVLKRTRFRLRDAQLLVVHSPRRGGEAVAAALDALAVRVDRIRSGLTGVHPDYWAALTEAERIESEVRAQVERYRALPAQ